MLKPLDVDRLQLGLVHGLADPSGGEMEDELRPGAGDLRPDFGAIAQIEAFASGRSEILGSRLLGDDGELAPERPGDTGHEDPAPRECFQIVHARPEARAAAT